MGKKLPTLSVLRIGEEAAICRRTGIILFLVKYSDIPGWAIFAKDKSLAKAATIRDFRIVRFKSSQPAIE